MVMNTLSIERERRAERDLFCSFGGSLIVECTCHPRYLRVVGALLGGAQKDPPKTPNRALGAPMGEGRSPVWALSRDWALKKLG